MSAAAYVRWGAGAAGRGARAHTLWHTPRTPVPRRQWARVDRVTWPPTRRLAERV